VVTVESTPGRHDARKLDARATVLLCRTLTFRSPRI
jgi:hypothetical protein